jgi:hypothetical protein
MLCFEVCARELSAMGGISASGVEDGRADAGGRDDGPVAYSANSSTWTSTSWLQQRCGCAALRCAPLRCCVTRRTGGCRQGEGLPRWCVTRTRPLRVGACFSTCARPLPPRGRVGGTIPVLLAARASQRRLPRG